MQETRVDPDAYLEAFMNGFDFVLLAMRGRLAEDSMPAAERARIEAFVADYARIPRAYRDRREGPPTGMVIGPERFKAELAAVTSN